MCDQLGNCAGVTCVGYPKHVKRGWDGAGLKCCGYPVGGGWRVLKDYVPHSEVAAIISSLKAVHEQQTRHCTMHAFTHTQYVAGLVTKLGADVTQCARLGHNAASK